MTEVEVCNRWGRHAREKWFYECFDCDAVLDASPLLEARYGKSAPCESCGDSMYLTFTFCCSDCGQELDEEVWEHHDCTVSREEHAARYQAMRDEHERLNDEDRTVRHAHIPTQPLRIRIIDGPYRSFYITCNGVVRGRGRTTGLGNSNGWSWCFKAGWDGKGDALLQEHHGAFPVHLEADSAATRSRDEAIAEVVRWLAAEFPHAVVERALWTQVTLIPDCRLTLVANSDLDVDRFKLLFLETWAAIPAEARDAIAVHWRERGADIVLDDCYPWRTANEYAHCNHMQRQLCFSASILAFMPDDAARAIIAHELVHYFCRVTGQDWDDTHSWNDTRRVNEVVSEWGYDGECVDNWSDVNSSAVDRLLDEINARHKRCTAEECTAELRLGPLDKT